MRLNAFLNQESRVGNSRITGMEYLNHHDKDKTLLAVGTDDGSMRIWSNFSNRNDYPNLITAWQAIHEPPMPKFGTVYLLTLSVTNILSTRIRFRFR